MDFYVKNTNTAKTKTQCAVVFIFESKVLASTAAIDEELGGSILQQVKLKDKEMSPGQCAWISVPNAQKALPYQRVLMVQLGKSAKRGSLMVTQKTWHKACAALSAQVMASSAKDMAVFIDDLAILGQESTFTISKILSEQCEKASYRYTATKEKAKAVALKKVSLITAVSDQAKQGLSYGKACGEGINLARELGNLPPNICTPKYLANLAKKMGEDEAALSVKILGEKQMGKLGMGSFLSVSKGSDEDGKLIVMEYNNAGKDAKPHVLVGKGITFDTGGISLKPGAQMDEMKFDMCGAASVFGTMHSLMAMQAKVNVVAIVAAAENMPSGGASKPGDVVTSMSGQTIEILNTDAEGRLVLCDALTYAERYQPETVVDVATLTGACVVALGGHATGLFTEDDKLAAALLAAGENSQDRAWRMPLWEAYQKGLDSNFADMANIGGGREAGHIVAACFLSRFTKSYRWAHLDIAGTAWLSGAKKGATGRPVSLLLDYFVNA